MLILQVLNIVCNCVTIRAIHREEKEEIRRRKKEFDEKNRLRAALSQSQPDNLGCGNEYQTVVNGLYCIPSKLQRFNQI